MSCDVMDLGVASYLNHLHTNLLKQFQVNEISLPQLDVKTYLDVTIVGVDFSGRGDWPDPLQGGGRASGNSSGMLKVVGKVGTLVIWDREDLHERVTLAKCLVSWNISARAEECFHGKANTKASIGTQHIPGQ